MGQKMLKILPPVVVLMALFGAWVPQKALSPWFRRGSGWRGFLVVLVAGSMSAGPLYLAFPFAAILASKGARYAHVVFFLGVWSTTKITVLAFEISSLGRSFTATHVACNLLVFFVGSLFLERLSSPKDLQRLAGSCVRKGKDNTDRCE